MLPLGGLVLTAADRLNCGSTSVCGILTLETGEGPGESISPNCGTVMTSNLLSPSHPRSLPPSDAVCARPLARDGAIRHVSLRGAVRQLRRTHRSRFLLRRPGH